MPRLQKIRLVLWIGVVLAVGVAAYFAYTGTSSPRPPQTRTTFGGPFSLIGADGKPFSSSALVGKPYAMYFGFTRCGDVCPTTLQRLVRLRRTIAGDNAFNVVFVTIDPQHDGPAQVGQYAELFGAPIIGLTGSMTQVDQVKKQYGIFARPSDHSMPGKEMEHTAIVQLFDRKGQFAGTLSAGDPDQTALAKLSRLVG
jgi:protein SCO1/2